jgi:NADPH:quinone reductase-like Zn-dependent oxidoreductase
MKACITDCKGIDNLTVIDTDAPDSGKLRRDDVLVDVHAVSLNFRDLMVAKGIYSGVPEKPYIAVSDMSGVVAEVGEGVTTLKPGDRVLNAPFRNFPAGRMRSEWQRTFVGGHSVDGVATEQIIYPAESLVKLPEHMSFEQGSTLTIAALTAWAAVVTHGHIRAGGWVLLHGTGGVSIFAAQIARMFGARTIMTTSSKNKAKIVQDKLGVEHILDYNDPSWPDKAKQLTDGGVDVVVEVAGGETLGRSIAACNYQGRVNVIGVLGGVKSEINIRDMLTHQVIVRGIFMESVQELRDMTRAFAAAKLEPWIDKTFEGFGQIKDAYKHLESQQHMGKVVIKLR